MELPSYEGVLWAAFCFRRIKKGMEVFMNIVSIEQELKNNA